MSRPEEAEKAFLAGVNCAQAMLVTYGPAYGLDESLALKIGSGLGGGVGHTGDICGAVMGACIVLGLKYGSSDKSADRKAPIDKVKEYVDRFATHCGTVDCLLLLGASIRAPEELTKARQEGLFKTRCPRYVRAAAEILEDFVD